MGKSPHQWASHFEYPPPNFEKPKEKGWTMIARAIISPEEKLGK